LAKEKATTKAFTETFGGLLLSGKRFPSLYFLYCWLCYLPKRYNIVVAAVGISFTVLECNIMLDRAYLALRTAPVVTAGTAFHAET
jgi:hypothetical protein